MINMNKRVLFVAIVITLSFGLSSAYGLGEDNEKISVLQKLKNAYNDFRARQQQRSQVVNSEVLKRPSLSKDQPKNKEMTREDVLAELKKDIVDNDEVFDAVPELKTGADQDENVVYVYNDKALDELSREDLDKLYSRVRRALVKIRTDRIERQLGLAKQTEKLRNVANLQQPPRIPAAPPSAPKVPAPPPSAPQRR